MEINDLLDECKKRLGVETDYELHKKTGMNEAAISKCRRGLGNANNQMLFIVAEVLGMDEKRLIAEFEAKYAKSEKTREFWKKKLAELGGIAAAIFVVVNLIMTPPPSQAAPVLKSEGAILYIM